jgi:ribosome-associated toxin RatA of RatAB toxin-antitoxin module
VTSSLERRLLLPYGAASLFDLVADVERYPEFVPGWREVRVSLRESDRLLVEQSVSFGPGEWRFVSEARLDRPRAIEIQTLGAPFGELAIRWTFEALDQSGCAVVFSARYRLGIGFVQRLVDAPFNRRLVGLVDAFERRAHALYGAQH